MHPHVFFIVVHQGVVMVLSLFGNLFLLFVIFRGNRVARRSISPVQLLLIHTCAADLLFALLSLGTEILTMISHPHFPDSQFLCKFMRYWQMVPHYSSPFLLVAISADRFQAICRPFANFRASRYRRPTALAISAWAAALILSVPQVFVWEMKYSQRSSNYTNGTHEWYGVERREECGTIYGAKLTVLKNAYIIVFNAIAWLIPSIVAGYFYYRVCKTVWMSGSRAPKVESEKEELNGNLVTQDYIDSLRKKSNGFRMQENEFDRKRVQTVRLTLTIIVCNFFLWLPFCVANVLLALFPNLFSAKIYLYVMTLGNLNSCVNPWIYIAFNRSHVKKAFQRCRAPGTPGYGSKSDRASFRVTNSTMLTPSPSVKQCSARIQKNRVSFHSTTRRKSEEIGGKTEEKKTHGHLAAILSHC